MTARPFVGAGWGEGGGVRWRVEKIMAGSDLSDVTGLVILIVVMAVVIMIRFFWW